MNSQVLFLESLIERIRSRKRPPPEPIEAVIARWGRIKRESKAVEEVLPLPSPVQGPSPEPSPIPQRAPIEAPPSSPLSLAFEEKAPPPALLHSHEKAKARFEPKWEIAEPEAVEIVSTERPPLTFGELLRRSLSLRPKGA
ncbi:MAG: hypothetical protein NZM37_00830 [Sandaracinaceae bacterium]|nr:hypothetical protein [Sandaracinaceae bacterium]